MYILKPGGKAYMIFWGTLLFLNLCVILPVPLALGLYWETIVPLAMVFLAAIHITPYLDDDDEEEET